MKNVYWSMSYPPNLYRERNILHDTPDALLKGLRQQQQGIDLTKPHYLKCPAFLGATGNVFVVRNTLHLRVAVRGQQLIPMDEASKQSVSGILIRPPTRTGYPIIGYWTHPLFFSPEPLVMAVMPAFMHHSDAQTKMHYIPGAFDIGRWFRPVDSAFELHPGTSEFCFEPGDPMFYVKFFTDERINLVRYQLTEELSSMAHGCTQYSHFVPHSPLERIYGVFEQAEIRSRLLKLIEQNLLVEAGSNEST